MLVSNSLIIHDYFAHMIAKFAVFQSFCITHGKLTAQSGVGASISRL